MMQDALNKIQTEMESKPNDKYVQVVGDFLLKHLRANPENASLIMAEGKTIAGSLDTMREEAMKTQFNGAGVLTYEEGCSVVLKYFGVEEKKQKPTSFDVALEDLMG